MTIEEKRKKIEDFCNQTDCCEESCPLNAHALRGELCYSEGADIERNFAIVFGTQTSASKLERHAMICDEIKELYRKKNADYGDSFHKTFLEEGMAMPRIRLTDKLERFKRLTKTSEQNIKDESIRDTLIDLANYSIMTILEMECEQADV